MRRFLFWARGWVPFWTHRFETNFGWKMERDHVHLGHRIIFFERPYVTEKGDPAHD